jgi:hypothetical protein
MTEKHNQIESESNSNNGKSGNDNMIKQMFSVFVGVVLIAGWGIPIGINYQRMNGFEKAQTEYQQKTDDRISKIDDTVQAGMLLRVSLQGSVQTLQKTADDNSKKLDKIQESITNHIINDRASVNNISPDTKTN